MNVMGVPPTDDDNAVIMYPVGKPPPKEGVQYTPNLPFPASTPEMLGCPGGGDEYDGVTWEVVMDRMPVPVSFVAVTANVYAQLFVSPYTTHAVAGADTVVVVSE